MQEERAAAGAPAAERAVAGLCHDLNNRLASVSAYAFVMKRRGLLSESGDPLEAELEGLAASVRLIRSICRSSEIEIGPVALTLIIEEATLILASYPDGPIALELHPDDVEAGPVVRTDWTRAIRAVVCAAAWIRRGVDPTEVVRVTVRAAEGNTIELSASNPLPDAEADPLTADCDGAGIDYAELGPRAVSLRFFDERKN